MTTIALFTRNLRLHDNPVLAAAARAGDTVLPLFVLDEHILRSAFNRPNRAHFLAASLADLHDGLQARGGGLVHRRGDWVDEVCRLAEQVDAAEVHVSSDVTAHSGARLERLRDALGGSQLCVHEQVVTVLEPGAITPSGRSLRDLHAVSPAMGTTADAGAGDAAGAGHVAAGAAQRCATGS